MICCLMSVIIRAEEICKVDLLIVIQSVFGSRLFFLRPCRYPTQIQWCLRKFTFNSVSQCFSQFHGCNAATSIEIRRLWKVVSGLIQYYKHAYSLTATLTDEGSKLKRFRENERPNQPHIIRHLSDLKALNELDRRQKKGANYTNHEYHSVNA